MALVRQQRAFYPPIHQKFNIIRPRQPLMVPRPPPKIALTQRNFAASRGPKESHSTTDESNSMFGHLHKEDIFLQPFPPSFTTLMCWISTAVLVAIIIVVIMVMSMDEGSIESSGRGLTTIVNTDNDFPYGEYVANFHPSNNNTNRTATTTLHNNVTNDANTTDDVNNTATSIRFVIGNITSSTTAFGNSTIAYLSLTTSTKQILYSGNNTTTRHKSINRSIHTTKRYIVTRSISTLGTLLSTEQINTSIAISTRKQTNTHK